MVPKFYTIKFFYTNFICYCCMLLTMYAYICACKNFHLFCNHEADANYVTVAWSLQEYIGRLICSWSLTIMMCTYSFTVGLLWMRYQSLPLVLTLLTNSPGCRSC